MSRNDVITFKIDSQPSGFDRPVTEYFKEQVSAKLADAGITSLTVIIKRGPHRELVLHFVGADEDVEKAKAAFASAWDGASKSAIFNATSGGR